MRCPICKQKLLKKCPKCGADLTINKNIICGAPVIPDNHCYNCWVKK